MARELTKTVGQSKPMTVTKFLTAGSGTYTVPSGVAWIKVRIVGAGGGGGGAGVNGSTGQNAGQGGASSFGGIVTCNGGFGGQGASANPQAGASGGSVSVTGIPSDRYYSTSGNIGSDGEDSPSATGLNMYILGGVGAVSPGFAGGGGRRYRQSSPGRNGVLGSGGHGGNTGYQSSGGSGGAGGGSGGYAEVIITDLQPSYSYTVGAGGTSGAGGSGGGSGGVGGSGAIVIEEYY